MYKVSHYVETDRNKMIAFAREHSFAMVISPGDDFPIATQVPLDIVQQDDQLFFTGHMMRKTDHQLAFEKNDRCLVTFTSPHAYVSAAWYENPRVGSTVNYMAVHAKGIIHFTDEEGTYEAVKQITEERIGPGTTASFDNLPQEYIDRMVKAIVGFKIKVSVLEAVFALSQSKSETDRRNIIAHLETRSQDGDRYIAAKMKSLLP